MLTVSKGRNETADAQYDMMPNARKKGLMQFTTWGPFALSSITSPETYRTAGTL